MRLKIVVPVLLLAAGLFGAAFWFSSASHSRGARRDDRVEPVAERINDSVVSTTIREHPSMPSPNAGTNHPTPRVDHARYVEERVAELQELALKGDAAAQEGILTELENP